MWSLFAQGAENSPANPDTAATSTDSSALTLHLVGHAHIDLAYRWRWNETVQRIARDTFRGVLDVMDKEPGLTFAQSQMALYEAVRKDYPDLYARIKERVKEGRWRVVGATWCEPDMIVPSGESFIRQRLLGAQFAQEEFGVDDIKTMWVPDSFCGHASTLPKILSGCGVEYYLFERGAPANLRVFRWTSDDGSSILAYALPAPYNLQLTQLTMQSLSALAQWSQKASNLNDVLLLYGVGDHGGGPRDADVAAKHALEKLPGAPKLVYDTPEKYFQTILAPRRDSFPIYQGALSGLHNSSFSSQAGLKRDLRRCENLLLTAEKFRSLGSYLQRKPAYPRINFAEAWKVLLFNQCHDILSGTSVEPVYEEAKAGLARVEGEAHSLLHEGLACIGNRVDTRGPGIPLLVFNPASWERRDIVEISISFVEPVESFRLEDTQGCAVPWQKLEATADHRKWRVLADVVGVPSLGYCMLRAIPGQNAPVLTNLTASVSALENERLRVTLSPSGTILSVYDKQAERETLDGEANLPAMPADTGPSSSWNSVPSKVLKKLDPIGKPELIEQGPVRARVRTKVRSEDSLFTLDTILCSGSSRLEFELTADWHEKDVQFLLRFPTTVKAGTAAFEQPYGFEEHPPDGVRRCAQRWLDLSSNDYGVSLLNDGCYEFYADAGEMKMGVLRGARDMDPRMDDGAYRLRYALYPHAKSWRDSDTVRQAFEVNNPLIATQESHHVGETDSWGPVHCDFALPPSRSFISVSDKNVAVSVVKPEQDAWTIDGALVIRVYETSGRPATCQLTMPFPVKDAVESDHLERPLPGNLASSGDKVTVTLRPGAIKTIRVIPAAAGSAGVAVPSAPNAPAGKLDQG